MLVKTLERKDGKLFIEDEINRYFGICSEEDFVKCMLSKDAVDIDGELFYHVDKNRIIEFCVK